MARTTLAVSRVEVAALVKRYLTDNPYPRALLAFRGEARQLLATVPPVRPETLSQLHNHMYGRC